MLREPTPPGRGKVKSCWAAPGSAKMLTLPAFLKVPVFGFAGICVIPVSNQSVGQPCHAEGDSGGGAGAPGSRPPADEGVQQAIDAACKGATSAYGQLCNP